MLTRREFIGAGIGVAAAAQALALPGDKMRYAMSGHQFRGLKPHPETGVKMTAQYGYHGLEPFQDDMPQYFKQPPEVFKKVLDARASRFARSGAAANISTPHACRKRSRATPRARNNLAFRLQAPEGESQPACRSREPERGERQDPAKNLNEVGKRTMESGIKFAFHPHAWTLVERQPELDMMMELTDPKFVYLVLDTGHATLGGIDPVKALRDYYPRVASIHLKDAEAKYSTRSRMARAGAERRGTQTGQLYKRLGSGGVDFPPSSRSCDARNYDGWVTMDFDMPRPGEGTVEEDMNSHKKYSDRNAQGQLRS